MQRHFDEALGQLKQKLLHEQLGGREYRIFDQGLDGRNAERLIK